MSRREGSERRVSEILSSAFSEEGRFRHRIAYAWLHTPEAIDASILNDEDLFLEDLLPLVGPIAALQQFGTADEFRDSALAVRIAGVAVEAATKPPDKDWALERRARGRLALMKSGAKILEAEARRLADRLEEAERVLAARGLRFNRDTWRVERFNESSRPYSWRRKLVAAWLEAVRPGQSLRDVEIDQALRDELAAVLRWWLPFGEADPAKDGPIDRDLRNERAKRRPARRRTT